MSKRKKEVDSWGRPWDLKKELREICENYKETLSALAESERQDRLDEEMRKDSDELLEVTYTTDQVLHRIEAMKEERADIVRFLRKFQGFEAIAERIERGEHHDENWTK